MDNTNEIEMMKKIKTRLFSIGQIAGVLVVVYLMGQTMSVFKEYKYIGAGVQPGSVISVSGNGEVFAVPDIATITFSATKEAKTMDVAQKDVTTRISAAVDFLKKSGVQDKDIKTTNYNAYPKYEYQRPSAEMCAAGNCQPGKQVLVGYEVSETISVKIRNTDDTGKIVEGLGKLSVSDISGPNFSIDDEDALKAEARKEAIDDAKTKADILAKELGVKLVRVVSFNENNGGYPIYYAKAAMGMGGAMESDAVAPRIEKGENKISVDVNITYEIR